MRRSKVRLINQVVRATVEAEPGGLLVLKSRKGKPIGTMRLAPVRRRAQRALKRARVSGEALRARLREV